MKEIPLTKGQVALVDDDDYEYINQYGWYAVSIKGSFYAMRKKLGKTVYMHRVIAKTPKGMVVDHINHNTLDNRKENLRNCTQKENLRNQKGARKVSATGVLGVQLGGTGFRAHYMNNEGKQVRLSVRKTIEEAIADREQAIKENYGEFGSA